MVDRDPKNNQPNTNDWRTAGKYTLPEYVKGDKIIFPESIIAQFKPQEKTEEYNRYKKIMALSALQEISKSIGDIIGASGGAPIEKRDVNKTGLMAFSNYQNALKDYNDRLDRYNQLKYNLDMKAKEMNITKEQREKELDYNRDIENEKLNITTQENNKNKGFQWDIHNIVKDRQNNIDDWWIKHNARQNNVDIYDRNNKRYNITTGKLMAMVTLLERDKSLSEKDIKVLRQSFETGNLIAIQNIVQNYFRTSSYEEKFKNIINEQPEKAIDNFGSKFLPDYLKPPIDTNNDTSNTQQSLNEEEQKLIYNNLSKKFKELKASNQEYDDDNIKQILKKEMEKFLLNNGITFNIDTSKIK